MADEEQYGADTAAAARTTAIDGAGTVERPEVAAGTAATSGDVSFDHIRSRVIHRPSTSAGWGERLGTVIDLRTAAGTGGAARPAPAPQVGEQGGSVFGRGGCGVSAYAGGDSGIGVDAFAGGVDGIGVLGVAEVGTGVHGSGGAVGVRGTDDGAQRCVGVAALLSNVANPSPALEAATGGTGAAGSFAITNEASSASALSCSTAGSGPALAVEGVVAFSRSGVATVEGGRSSVAVDLPRFSAASVVFATIQCSEPGVHVQGVAKRDGSFTIEFNRAVPQPVEVGWFVVG